MVVPLSFEYGNLAPLPSSLTVPLCKACSLREHPEVKRPVPAEGPLDCLVMVIGRNPGQLENDCGRPFIGPAGQRLDRMLESLKVPREKCFITNAVRCYTLGNAPPPTDCLQTCAALHLDAELKVVWPRLIFVMGKEAQRAVKFLVEGKPEKGKKKLKLVKMKGSLEAYDPSFEVMKAKGYPHRTDLSHPVDYIFFLIHPSAALRRPEHEARLLKQTRAIKRLTKKEAIFQ